MASTDAQFQSLTFIPGFHRESTQYAEEGKWFDGNRVRFREGKPENLRGYEKFSDEHLDGIARDMLSWSDNESRPYIGVGTTTFLYAIQNQTQYDITPIVCAVSVSGNFETYTNKTLVRVSVNNFIVSTTDRVEFSGVATIGGNLNINGISTVVSISGTTSFYIDAGTTASSASVDQGSAGNISFFLQTQPSNAIQGLGYGAGIYNAGVSVSGARAWNQPAAESAITFLPAMWQLDNWGEDLMALRRGGQVYIADIDASLVPTRAVLISASPTATTFLVSPNDRHVVCYGAREICDNSRCRYKPNACTLVRPRRLYKLDT